MNNLKNLIKELTFRSGTGEQSIDDQVEALNNFDLPNRVVDHALETAHSWAPIFIDDHVERVEELLGRLELLGDIVNDTKESVVASLKSDFVTRSAWASVADQVNCWTDDSGVEYVEVGPQQ